MIKNIFLNNSNIRLQILCIGITFISLDANAMSILSRQDSLAIAKAEKAILKAADEYTPSEDDNAWGYVVPPHDDFEKLVKNNPHTLDYPFKALQEKGYVTICTSEDGQLRYYSWDTGHGGTMVNFSRIEQYRTPDGKVHVNAFTDGEFYCMANSISIMKNGSSPIYLVRDYFKESTCHFMLSVNAVTIDGGGLHRPDIFEEADSLTNSLGIYCNRCENSVQVEGYEKDFDYMYFEKGNKEILVAITEDHEEYFNMFTDHYKHYVFDGKIFRQRGIRPNPHLHASLSQYEYSHQTFVTKGYRIRIDKMSDGTYRYASWKRSMNMSDKPELIILGGTLDKEGRFIFNNEGYTYIVDDTLSSGFEKYLTIKKGQKQLLRQQKIDL